MANEVSFVVVMKDAFVSVSKRINTATTTMRKRFSGLGKGLSLLTRKFGGLITAAAGFFGLRKFFSEGMKFQDTIADLAAITGAAGKDLQFLQEESLRLAKVSIVSASETAGAFKLVASAKAELLEDPKALSNVTEQVLLLSNAAGTSLSDSALIVTESLNQFGASAEETNRFVNVLAAGSKFGASEVESTGAALVRAGVGSKLASVSFEKANAALQVMAQRGIKGQRAGTSLQTVFIRLESQANKRFKPSIVGLDQAMENLAKRNLSTAKMTKLFGREGLATGEILISSRKEVAEMEKKITGTSIASQQAAIRMATFSKRIESIGIAINEKLISVFQELENSRVFSSIATDFTKWLDTIKPSTINTFVASIRSMVTAIGVLGKVLSAVMVPFSMFFNAAESIAGFLSNKILGKFDYSALRAETKRESAALSASFLSEDILGKVDFSDLGKFSGGKVSNDILHTMRGAENKITSPSSAKVEGDINVNVTTSPGVSATVKTTAKTPGLSIGQNMQPVLQ